MTTFKDLSDDQVSLKAINHEEQEIKTDHLFSQAEPFTSSDSIIELLSPCYRYGDSL
jgi:hypothetical protein